MGKLKKIRKYVVLFLFLLILQFINVHFISIIYDIYFNRQNDF